MSRLEKATARFNAALDKLEKAAAPSAGSRTRLVEREKERGDLLARLAQLEEENRSLAGVNEDIETRLDTAIGEIRAALSH